MDDFINTLAWPVTEAQCGLAYQDFTLVIIMFSSTIVCINLCIHGDIQRVGKVVLL